MGYVRSQLLLGISLWISTIPFHQFNFHSYFMTLTCMQLTREAEMRYLAGNRVHFVILVFAWRVQARWTVFVGLIECERRSRGAYLPLSEYHWWFFCISFKQRLSRLLLNVAIVGRFVFFCKTVRKLLRVLMFSVYAQQRGSTIFASTALVVIKI